MKFPAIQNKMVLYIAWGTFLFFIVDFGTAGSFKTSYFMKYGLLLLVFYFGYPLFFSYLIFNRKWDEKRLFYATVAAMFFIEGILVRNPFVLIFPPLVLGIPLAICIYVPLTYFPLWIVNSEMGKHRKTIIALSAVIAVTTVLSIVTNW